MIQAEHWSTEQILQTVFKKPSKWEDMRKLSMTTGMWYGVKKMDWIKYIKKGFFQSKKSTILETTLKCVKKITLSKI